jgi:hypothetical protein
VKSRLGTSKMKPINVERVTFPEWHHKFKLTIKTTKGFVNALVAGESQISFKPDSLPTLTDILEISRWLLQSQATKLDFRCRFSSTQEYLSILTTLNHERLKYLAFNVNDASLEVLRDIVDFVSRANSVRLQLKTISLDFLNYGGSVQGRIKRAKILDKLFNIRYCPSIIVRWTDFNATDFEHFNFGNCRRLTIKSNAWDDSSYHAFLVRLVESKVTYLNFGVLRTPKSIQKLLDALSRTRVISLRLNFKGATMKYEEVICGLLQCRHLKYLSLWEYPMMSQDILEALVTSRLRYLEIGNGHIESSIKELTLKNISLCAFGDTSIGSEYFQRNMAIQKTIRQCAYTLLLIKNYRLHSIFKLLNADVVRMIVRMVLDSSHESVWLAVAPP